jgi:tetratricopeptide (TPR) repeat protein
MSPMSDSPPAAVAAPAAAGSPRRRRWPLAAGLAALTLAVYLPVLGHGFVQFDDPAYVLENPGVRNGLTAESVRWALGARVVSHWHPLTVLSHQLDVALWGLAPGGHHLTSLLLHTLATVLLFAWLSGATGRRWPSAWVAALFALHPTHVEAAAWVASRKDVLSGALWMAALAAYAAYARRPAALRWLATLALFALALTAKATALVLPAVMLLLDVWPLRRWRALAPVEAAAVAAAVAAAGGSPRLPRPRSAGELLVEKLPFFALSAASAAIALGAAEASRFPVEHALPRRLALAAVALATYVRQTVVPRGLAIFYPLRHDPPAAEVALAVALLVAITLLAALLWRRVPAVAVGWLWFLIAIAPVSGALQTRTQPIADRYTYVATVGLLLAAAWAGVALAERRPATRRALAALAAATVVAVVPLTAAQLATWRDTESLFGHAARVTERNAVAHLNYGSALAARGQHAAALRELERAVAYAPELADAQAALGETAARLGRWEQALAALRRAVALAPDDPRFRLALAGALDSTGDLAGARRELAALLRLDPRSARAHYGLGAVLERGGDLAAAQRHYRAAHALDPTLPGLAQRLSRAAP